MRRVLAFALMATVAAAIFAGGQRTAPIRIVDAWARETPGDTRTSAAYFVIENHGEAADVLIGASSPVAGVVELHTMERQGEVMRMRRVFGIDVPAGGEASLEPGGLHVMMMDLQQPLEAGDRIELTLMFDRAGEMTVETEVRSLRPMITATKLGETPHR